jgi:hypothetical protein
VKGVEILGSIESGKYVDTGLHWPGPGSTDNVVMLVSGPGSGLVQMIAVKCYVEHFGLSRDVLSSQIKSLS